MTRLIREPSMLFVSGFNFIECRNRCECCIRACILLIINGCHSKHWNTSSWKYTSGNFNIIQAIVAPIPSDLTNLENCICNVIEELLLYIITGKKTPITLCQNQLLQFIRLIGLGSFKNIL